MCMRIYFVLFYLIFTSCQQQSKSEHITIKTDLTVADTRSLNPQKTFTLLQTGPPLPPIYENVQDIVSKKYNLNFIWAGGCIVNKKLEDSISLFNATTNEQINKVYKRDVVTEINNCLSAEYKYLVALDKDLRTFEKDEKKLVSIYYVKKQNTYKAFYLFSSENKSHNTLKFVLEIDSSTKKVITKTQKDELQTYNLNQLQND